MIICSIVIIINSVLTLQVSTANKLSRANFFLNRVKHTLSPRALKSLYISFFHSHLLYCATIYSCTSQGNINTLFKQQKKAIRHISGAQHLEHTAPLFEQHRILPLDKVITHAKATFMHSIYYQYAPSSFADTWSTLSQLQPELNLRTLITSISAFLGLNSSKSSLFTLYLPPGMI